MKCYKLTLTENKYANNDPVVILTGVIKELGLPEAKEIYGFLYKQDTSMPKEFYFKTYHPELVSKLRKVFKVEEAEQPSVLVLNQYRAIGNGNLFNNQTEHFG